MASASANPRGVLAQDEISLLSATIPVDPAAIWAEVIAPVHTMPQYAFSPSGYAPVVNVSVLCNDPVDYAVTFGQTTNWGAGTGYTAMEMYDACFISNNASPLILNNIFNPYTDSTPVGPLTVAVVTTNGITTVTIPYEVIYGSLTVHGATSGRLYTNTALGGSDFSLAYTAEDNTQVTLTVLSSSLMAAEANVTLSFSVPNLANIDVNRVIGGVDGQGNYTGLEVIQSCYEDTGVVPSMILVPGWSKNPEVMAVMVAEAQGFSNNRFRAVAICNVDTSEVTNWTQLYTWKNNNNYVSDFLIACWPNAQLGAKGYELASLYAVGQNIVTKAFNNIPMAVPSNKHNVEMTGLCLGNVGTPVRMNYTTATQIENYGIVTAVNDSGWTLLGDYTTDFGVNTQLWAFWTIERFMFNYLGNWAALNLGQYIDDPGNQDYLTAIAETIQAYGHYLLNIEATDSFKVSINPALNLAQQIASGIYTVSVLWSPATPIRLLQFQMTYDTAGAAAAIAAITIPSV